MHERIAIHPICFPGSAPAQYVARCQALGARRVGLLSHELLADGGAQAARSALADTDLAVESITHLFFAGPLSSVRGEQQLARDRLSRLVDIAASVNARSIYMLTGGHGKGSWEEAADSFCEAVLPCVGQARAAGVELAVENASSLYAELHIAHSLADTLQLAEMADIGVCIELFFCWAEANLPELFARAMPRCRLVQVSDYVYGDRSLPARAVPGDGVIPLWAIIGELLEAGYDGAFDLELLGPRIDEEGADAAVARAAQFLEQVLIDRGA